VLPTMGKVLSSGASNAQGTKRLSSSETKFRATKTFIAYWTFTGLPSFGELTKERCEQKRWPMRVSRRKAIQIADVIAEKPMTFGSKNPIAVEQPWTSSEAANFLKIHPRTVNRMAKTGELPAFRIGTHWRFLPSELDIWMRSKLSSVAKLNPVRSS
jgi:excisionase family DNA binding protein